MECKYTISLQLHSFELIRVVDDNTIEVNCRCCNKKFKLNHDLKQISPLDNNIEQLDDDGSSIYDQCCGE